MKLHYYSETDSLYIDLSNTPSVDSREISDGFVVDYDDRGHIVGLDIQYASDRLDLSSLQIEHLPVAVTA